MFETRKKLITSAPSLQACREFPSVNAFLSACDFWLWGHLKHLVYQTEPPQNIEELKCKIRSAFQAITDDQRLRAIAEFDRRVRLCFDRRGAYVEI